MKELYIDIEFSEEYDEEQLDKLWQFMQEEWEPEGDLDYFTFD